MPRVPIARLAPILLALFAAACSSHHSTPFVPLGAVQGTVVLTSVHTDPNGALIDTVAVGNASGIRVFLTAGGVALDSTTTSGGSYRFRARAGTYLVVVRPLPAAAKWVEAVVAIGGVVTAAPIVIEPAGELSLAPNPSAGQTRTQFSLAADGPVALTIRGADGRVTRTLFSGMLPAGVHAILWDGLDDQGMAAPAGFYFFTLESTGEFRLAVLEHGPVPIP